MSNRAAGARSEVIEAAELRFGQVGIAQLRLHTSDPEAVRRALTARVAEAPALFTRAPLALDFSALATAPTEVQVQRLCEAVRAAGMLPVGLSGHDEASAALARRLDLPLLAKLRAAAPAPEQTPAAAPPRPVALQHPHPVRTGQQVYAKDSDLVVTGFVASGAEVLADGNIHVYGALRGRAFAGAQGEPAARIFCSEFRAEIVSIAGHYRVFEQLPTDTAGKAVQIWLGNDKLQIATL